MKRLLIAGEAALSTTALREHMNNLNDVIVIDEPTEMDRGIEIRNEERYVITPRYEMPEPPIFFQSKRSGKAPNQRQRRKYARQTPASPKWK